ASPLPRPLGGPGRPGQDRLPGPPPPQVLSWSNAAFRWPSRSSRTSTECSRSSTRLSPDPWPARRRAFRKSSQAVWATVFNQARKLQDGLGDVLGVGVLEVPGPAPDD